TGRMFVFIAKTNESEPRLQLYRGSAVFATNVAAQKPGVAAILDQSTNGFPPESLRDVPAGDYYIQALLNIYTEFHRADGHVIWAHMDQWEGQQFNRSPGNFVSEVQRVHLDAGAGYTVKLNLDHVLP